MSRQYRSINGGRTEQRIWNGKHWVKRNINQINFSEENLKHAFRMLSLEQKVFSSPVHLAD